ncbi:MAG: class I SAM-dependent methyltransferase [Candidatus Pacearchaeota archaeon]
MEKYLKSNKKLWNELTKLHQEKNNLYSINDFRSGKTTLSKTEINELGDISGKKILHLQCHFGLDSLSLAKMGARVTGVDFSEESIKLANHLNKESKLSVKFICADLYDLPEILNGKFDIVFTSYGVLLWLPDLNRWAKIISHFLKSKGLFYIIEGHPFSMILENKGKGINLFVKKSYFHNSPVKEKRGRDYANPKQQLKNTAYTWNHPISEVINSLVREGLKIDFLHEFPYSCEAHYNNMELKKEGWWFKGKREIIPMMFSLRATKEK